MRVSDLISLGQRYLGLGILIVVVLAAVFTLIYYKFFKGKINISISKIFVWGILVCYIIVVLGVTLLDRGNFWQNGRIMPLFYSYKDAWVNFSVTSWRNIILNICMFIPLGVLLPMAFPFFRSFWKTYLAGFVITILIEGMQLVLNRGMFELDDLLNNTVGTMIGYGIYVFGAAILSNKIQKSGKKYSITQFLLLQLPLFTTVIGFALIFALYERQELGNVGYQCLVPYDVEKLQVSSDIELDSEQMEVPVYLCKTLTKEDAEVFAASFFENLGTQIDETRNDFYEDTAIFYAEERYNLWVNYKGGDYSFTDFETSFPEKPIAINLKASEEEVRKVLLSYGIEIPEQSVMEVQMDAERFVFEIAHVEEDGKIKDGIVSGQYCENGCFSDVDYSVIEGEYYKDFAVISEQEAYEMICNGEFDYRADTQIQVQVKACELEYTMDSKGFYQPVYNFSCDINGEETEIKIAAIQDDVL